MSHHDLKLWPKYMEAKKHGVKPWEHRSTTDRTFDVGDTVAFFEWNPETAEYTGHSYGPVSIIYIHYIGDGNCIFTHDTPREYPPTRVRAP